MNKFIKTALVCFASNMLLLFLFYRFSIDGGKGITSGLLWIAYLFLQLIVGLVMSFQSSRKEIGNGIMLGGLLGMLVGFLVCSGFSSMR